MTEPNMTPSSEPLSPAATATPSTTRKWLSGAALVAAGLVAGSGATYAATVNATPTETQSMQLERGERMGGPGGTPPSGAPVAPDDAGSQPS